MFRENPTEKINTITTETQEKSIAAEGQTREATTATEEHKKESINYNIMEDVHTKTGNKIWIVKPEKELSKADFTEVKRKLATLQGYYSSYVRGFIFKYNPEEALKTS